MNFAIYSRKSYFTDTSESTKMQVDACQEYIERHHDDVESVTIYEDDGYVRSEIDRPGMNRLRQDVADGLIDCVVVYRIDRITSKMDDFCIFYAFLKDRGVKFVTVKDGIDTTTPIGEAMMYLAVIFSGIEVENDTLRITDNMNHLAASGYWCGGKPPLGLKIQEIFVGGRKSHKILVIDEEAKAWKDELVRIFLDNHLTLQNLETYCRQQGIKSMNGKFLSTTQLYNILRAPQCVAATTKMYDYYESLGCQIDEGSPREKWDGSCAIMVYGRTTEKRIDGKKKHTIASPEEWRVSLAKWAPYMSDEIYLSILSQFGKNKIDKKMKHETTLLKGVLRCKCGRLMSLARKPKVDGSVTTWYHCPKRERAGVEACDCSAIKADLIDEKVMDIFRAIELDPKTLEKYVGVSVKAPADATEAARRALKTVEGKIARLTDALAENGASAAAKYIVQQIEELDAEASRIRRKIAEDSAAVRRAQKELKSTKEKRVDIIRLCEHYDDFTMAEKNEIARAVIKSATWDGETLKILL